MKSHESYYSSVSDRWWFLGNPNLDKKNCFTWFIDKSGFETGSGRWKISVSEAGAEYLLPGNFNFLHIVNKKQPPYFN